ncbi:MAG: hypothetical protein ACYSX0_04775 [Planctomycetota bacterium]
MHLPDRLVAAEGIAVVFLLHELDAAAEADELEAPELGVFLELRRAAAGDRHEFAAVGVHGRRALGLRE